MKRTHRCLLAALACTPLLAFAEPAPTESAPLPPPPPAVDANRGPGGQMPGMPGMQCQGMPGAQGPEMQGPGKQGPDMKGPGMPGMQGPGMMPHGDQAPGLAGLPTPPWLHGIHLTEAQEDQVFTILHGQMPAIREQFKAIRHAHEGLRDLEKADKFDEGKAKSLADSLGRATASLAQLQATGQARIRAVLTAEQRKQLSEQMQRPPRPEGEAPRRDGKDQPRQDKPAPRAEH